MSDVTFSYEADTILLCPFCGRDANPDVECPGCFRVSTQKQMLGEEPLDGVKPAQGRPKCSHGDRYRLKNGRCSKCK